ncbi:hypothetical protein DZF97_00725 [Clavibacter nebraskensis]|uniref:Uncharacterized protein n=1 Tax=Clavibacter nebraskensis TaxID=31963 RepID=A0A399QP56_9MICO|nr:hypothetical protein DZF97_00725 [Clavibacter nebraskensis]
MVDGARPAIERVAALPQSYKLSDGERLVLFVLAADSFGGSDSAPGMDSLAQWTGMFRGHLHDMVDRLCQPGPDGTERPPLLQRVPGMKGGRGKRLTFRLLLPPLEPASGSGGYVDRDLVGIPASESGGFDAPEPAGKGSGKASGKGASASVPLPIPSPLPTPLVPQPVQDTEPVEPGHEREPDALRALATLVEERRLPLTAAELLPHASRLGDGDPWVGYLEVKRRSVQSLDDARSPRHLLLHWLREPAQPSRAAASRPPHVRAAAVGRCPEPGHEEYSILLGPCAKCEREQEDAA